MIYRHVIAALAAIEALSLLSLFGGCAQAGHDRPSSSHSYITPFDTAALDANGHFAWPGRQRPDSDYGSNGVELDVKYY